MNISQMFIQTLSRAVPQRADEAGVRLAGQLVARRVGGECGSAGQTAVARVAAKVPAVDGCMLGKFGCRAPRGWTQRAAVFALVLVVLEQKNWLLLKNTHHFTIMNMRGKLSSGPP